MRAWENLKSFFHFLNLIKIKYVVLRNYDELFEADFLKNHADIDFLCENADQFVRCADAVPRGKKNDRVHFKVQIDGIFVPIDVRETGDNYYDAAWEADMLNTRVLYKDFCYILDHENYYYSLCYHALLQKRTFSNEYRSKLACLKPELKNITAEDYLKSLEAFMKAKNYMYCYPVDRGVVFRYQVVDKKMISANFRESIYRKRKESVYALKTFLKSAVKKKEE